MKEPMLAAGTLISHYRVASRLGAGGMGEVYLAQDTHLGRRVALKILPEEFARDENRLRRFKQEACAASALNHPNILTIHEIGEADFVHYIATEFIDGVTLRQLIKDGQMKLGEVLDVAAQAAGALAAAHAAGIVHRDIKPENIMVRADGYVKVLDFGLAKLTENPANRPALDSNVPTQPLVNTDAGVVVGTAYYMSPEQARGLPVDARTDVFSLGVVIYEILAGRAPFSGPTKSDVIAAILEREPPPLARYSREVPAELERIITKALVKDREERYQTIKDVALDIRRLKQELEFETKLKRSAQQSQPESERLSAGDAPTLVESAAHTTLPAQAGKETQTSSGDGSFINRIRDHKKIAVLALSLLVSGILIYFIAMRGGNRFAGPGKAIDSIAILPFVNTGNDPNAEYLSDGITESLINSLSQLPNLKVMSRNSVFRYKGREWDAQEVARQLGVRAVMTGRVVQQGDGLAISVELVNAEDNSHIWGGQYKRKLSDIFAVQEEIAKEISEKLRLRLSGEEEKLLTRRYTNDTEAYQLYLKCNYYRNKFTPEAERAAIDYCTQAIVKDPNFALPYAGLAHSYEVSANNGWMRPHDAYPKAKAAIAKGLELDPNNATIQSAAASTAMFYDWDWATAEREFKRAIEIEPNYWHHHEMYSYLLSALGRTDEAIAEAKRAQEIDPLSLIAHSSASGVFYRARQYDRSIEQARKALELDAGFPFGHRALARNFMQQGKYEESIAEYKQMINLAGRTSQALGELGNAYAVSGKRAEALKLLDELKEMSANRYVSPLDFAFIYTGLADKEQAFVYLEKAYQERSTWLMFIKVDPRFDPLRSDHRFTDIMRRMGLAQ